MYIYRYIYTYIFNIYIYIYNIDSTNEFKSYNLSALILDIY